MHTTSKLKLCLVNVTFCLCLSNAQAQVAPPVSPVAIAASIAANIDNCIKDFPAHSQKFSKGWNVWASKNQETIRATRSYPGFDKLVSDTRKSLVESGQAMSLDACISYANNISS